MKSHYANLPATLLAVAFIVPLNSPERWHSLQYSRTPASEVTHLNEGIRISVKNSAHPLFYSLPIPLWVNGIDLEGRVDGLIRIPEGLTEGLRAPMIFHYASGLFWKETIHCLGLKKFLLPPGLSRFLNSVRPKALKRSYF